MTNRRTLDYRFCALLCVVGLVSLPNQFGTILFETKKASDANLIALLGATQPSRLGTKNGGNVSTSELVAPKINLAPTFRVTAKKRRRVFLGILNDLEDNGRYKTVIRKTYLHEHRQPIKVCPITAMHHDCDVVYAFIELMTKNPASKHDASDVICVPDKDVTNPVWAMYQYLQKANLLREQSGTDDASTDIRFDFVSHTWCTCVLYPDRVWPRELFDGSTSGDSVYDVYPRIFSWGSRENASMSEGGYRLVSSTLVHDVFNQTAFHRRVPLGKSEGFLAGVVRKIGKQTGEFETAAHMDHQMTGRHVDSSVAIALLPIQNAGSKMMPIAIKRWGNHDTDLITAWDVYKDKHLVTTYQDPGEVAFMAANSQTIQTRCRHGPRMLLGIMSVLDDAKEIKRRQTIRETYLRYYIDTNSTDKRFRICALHEFLDTTHPNHTQLLHECQLVYTFVIGGNTTGPTERMEYSAAEPMTLPSPVSEPDVVMLNIKENMNEGKTQTYFKYGTMLCDEYIYFDYIAKTDTDTLFYVNKFLDSDLNHFPSFPDNGQVYGGWRCYGKRSIEKTEGVIYYAGSFFFLSPDMARFITSDACDRQRLDRFAEDWTIGAFVDAHPLPQHRIRVGWSRLIHPLKNVTEYRGKWMQFIE